MKNEKLTQKDIDIIFDAISNYYDYALDIVCDKLREQIHETREKLYKLELYKLENVTKGLK